MSGNKEFKYDVIYYKDNDGKEPVRQFIDSLGEKKDKNSRVNYNKILDYVNFLKKYGTPVGMPYVDHLGSGLYELRPLDNRILFAAWDGNKFIFLHHFRKTTQKTPRREIAIAKRRFKYALEQEDDKNEQ